MAQFLDLTLLKRNHSYALLFTSQFVSLMGSMMTMVALPFQIYALTHSAVMVGLLSFVQLLPLLVTALLGGVFADRYRRKRILLISESFLALSCLVLAINGLISTPNVSLIFIFSGIMSAFIGLHRPSYEGLIQQLVRNEDYKVVGSFRTFAMNFCMIVGPAMAGLMIARFGVAVTYCIDVLTFVFSMLMIIALGQIPKISLTDTKSVSIVQDLKEGILFAWQRQVLLGSYCVDFLAMLFAMPNALFPAIALNIGGVKTLGFLYAAPAVGALIISFWSGWTANVKREGQAIALSAIGWGIAIVGFGLSSSLMPALFFLALAGAFDACSGIFRVSLWNNMIPQNLRGRLAGIEMLSYLSGPKLGDTRAGLTAAIWGIGPAIVLGGVLCVVGVGFCCYRLRGFWRYSA